MKIKYTYIANDGTEFKDKASCEEYEKTMYNNFLSFKENVIAFNCKGKRLLYDSEEEFIDIYDGYGREENTISYLNIIEDLLPDQTEFIRTMGYSVIPSKAGWYHYNAKSYDYDNFYDDWGAMFEVLKEEY